MLLNLHVKNFALIEEADIDFGDGLNILTGETGAGKSILIDAVTAALGGRTRGEMIRSGCDSAYAELTFSVTEPEKIKKLQEAGIEPEYDCITVSRRLMPKRSIHKINGETVTSALVRQVTVMLLDIHGQHEHQSLMNPSRHREVLDQYGGTEAAAALQAVGKAYDAWCQAGQELARYNMDPETRSRQMDFLQFEIAEIVEAAVQPGETEKLETQYRRIQNSQKICGALQAITQILDGDGRESVRDMISAASREINSAVRYDDGLNGMQEELSEIEDLISGLSRELGDYIEDITFDEEEFRQMEERLDLLHHLESKYGSSYDEIMQTLTVKQEALAELEEYEKNLHLAGRRMAIREMDFKDRCTELSEIRRRTVPGLQAELTAGIKELNFNYVDFRIRCTDSETPGRLGSDDVEFLISLNPGQPARPLGQVASGGELSRIMLAIKTALADKDEIPTLIFDEIDTGISGRTAQKVSEKLNLIGRHRQVICITHLPQIASMADHHYEIRKRQDEERTITQIRLLDEKDSINELARLLGGAEITETVYLNACEMKKLAEKKKTQLAAVH